jgi:hypothetical protein
VPLAGNEVQRLQDSAKSIDERTAQHPSKAVSPDDPELLGMTGDAPPCFPKDRSNNLLEFKFCHNPGMMD